jgi:RNA recognition motif-containing protein
MVESDTADSCDSDAEAIGKSYTENAQKRQQGASKQKRMMGNIGNGGKDRQQQEAAEEEEELPNKITDLLVLGLPFELTDDELKAYFEAFGKVVHCEVCLIHSLYMIPVAMHPI